MRELVRLAEDVTGKRVELGGSWFWAQDEDAIYVPDGDEEGLVHEVLHWVVASDSERTWPNLALDAYDEAINAQLPPEERLEVIDVDARERQCCYLERKVFALRDIALRGSCTAYGDPDDEGKAWADERAQSVRPGLLEELAAALVTGRSLYL